MEFFIGKLSTAMEKLGYGEPVSKRIEGEPRKVYAVLEKSDLDEEVFQQEIKREYSPARYSTPTT